MGQTEKGRILGIGGTFFQSPDKAALQNWYKDKLGIDSTPPEGKIFPWKSIGDNEQEHMTVWSIFPDGAKNMADSASKFMINYIVDDMDAFLEKAAAAGVRIDPKREDYDFGRFAWIFDLDGNKIELWQPLG